MSDKNMELGLIEKSYSKYSNLNRIKHSIVEQNVNDQDLYTDNIDLFNLKNESGKNLDSLRSTDSSYFSRLSEISKNSSTNSDTDLDLVKQNIYLYIELLEKFIRQFEKSMINFKKKKFNSKPKASNSIYLFKKKKSPKKTNLYALIKLFKQLKKSSKFLIECHEDDSIFSRLEKLFQKGEKNSNVLNVKNQVYKKYKPNAISGSLKCRPRLSSLSSSCSSSSSEGLDNTKSMKIEEKNFKKPDHISSHICKDTNCFLNYESIFANEIKKPSFYSNLKHSTPNNQSFSNDASYSLFEKLDINQKDQNDSKSSNSFDKYHSNPNIFQSKNKIKEVKNKPKTSRYKVMKRSHYEALKIQLNVFREDYRMEFDEKMHIKNYYEQKLKQIEFSNTNLKKELEKLKFSYIKDPLDESPFNIT